MDFNYPLHIAFKKLSQYNYITIEPILSLYNKENLDEVIKFLKQKKIINDELKIIYQNEIRVIEKTRTDSEKTFKAIEWRWLIDYILKHTGILLNKKHYFSFRNKGISLPIKYFFKEGDTVYDIDGEDRKGWGKGVITGVGDRVDVLRVKFPVKNLPVLINGNLFVYDRAGKKGAVRCKFDNIDVEKVFFNI